MDLKLGTELMFQKGGPSQRVALQPAVSLLGAQAGSQPLNSEGG